MLRSDAGQFFVGRYVDDLKLFSMERWIGAERELAEIAFLECDEQFFVFGAKPFEHGWINDDAQLKIGIIARSLFENLAELALDFHAHGQRTLHFATAFAIG